MQSCLTVQPNLYRQQRARRQTTNRQNFSTNINRQKQNKRWRRVNNYFSFNPHALPLFPAGSPNCRRFPMEISSHILSLTTHGLRLKPTSHFIRKHLTYLIQLCSVAVLWHSRSCMGHGGPVNRSHPFLPPQSARAVGLVRYVQQAWHSDESVVG
jgi:hypothetical protein